MATKEFIIKEAEEKLVDETINLRVFKTDGISCANSFYSPDQECVVPATITFDENEKSITLAFADGGQAFSAREMLESLWGEDVRGTEGVAKSPHDRKMTENDFKQAQIFVETLMDLEKVAKNIYEYIGKIPVDDLEKDNLLDVFANRMSNSFGVDGCKTTFEYLYDEMALESSRFRRADCVTGFKITVEKQGQYSIDMIHELSEDDSVAFSLATKYKEFEWEEEKMVDVMKKSLNDIVENMHSHIVDVPIDALYNKATFDVLRNNIQEKLRDVMQNENQLDISDIKVAYMYTPNMPWEHGLSYDEWVKGLTEYVLGIDVQATDETTGKTVTISHTFTEEEKKQFMNECLEKDQHAAKIFEQMESHLVSESPYVRAFIGDDSNCANYFYSSKFKDYAAATLTYNTDTKEIIVGIAEGGKDFVAAELAKEWWGENAIGDESFAFSPENREMTEEDLTKATLSLEGKMTLYYIADHMEEIVYGLLDDALENEYAIVALEKRLSDYFEREGYDVDFHFTFDPNKDIGLAPTASEYEKAIIGMEVDIAKDGKSIVTEGYRFNSYEIESLRNACLNRDNEYDIEMERQEIADAMAQERAEVEAEYQESMNAESGEEDIDDR